MSDQKLSDSICTIKPQHSDGPWELVGDKQGKAIRRLKSDNAEADKYDAMIKADGTFVAVLDFGYGDKRNLANARMMTAAPLLYDACAYMLKELRDWQGELEYDEAESFGVYEAFRRLKSALNKAGANEPMTIEEYEAQCAARAALAAASDGEEKR